MKLYLKEFKSFNLLILFKIVVPLVILSFILLFFLDENSCLEIYSYISFKLLYILEYLFINSNCSLYLKFTMYEWINWIIINIIKEINGVILNNVRIPIIVVIQDMIIEIISSILFRSLLLVKNEKYSL